jgi:HEAT repeat protein
VPDLIEIGRNPGESNDLRETAILALGQIGPPASPAFPMLQKVLRETLCPQLRQEVFSALAALDTPEAVAALIDMLEHGDQQERLAILDGFSAQGAKAKSAAAALLAFAARHPDSGLCDWVFLTVTAFGPETAVELAAYLQADQLEIRRRAAFALSRLGSDTAAAVPALSEALRDEAEIVRFWAAKALGNIGPEARQATGPLLNVLGDADPNVRWQATTAIAKIDLGAITEDDWSRLLADPDPGVRQRAATIRSASL